MRLVHDAPGLRSDRSQLDRTDRDFASRMTREQRDCERLAVAGQLEGEILVFQPMAIQDISPSGAQIETAFALQLASLHYLRLALGDLSVIVKGRIVHCHLAELTDFTARYRVGLEFFGLPGFERRAIADFVAAMAHARRPPSTLDAAEAPRPPW